MNLDPYRSEIPPHREVLPGGAVLLSTPMRTAHAVTLGVWLRTGSQDEPADLCGVSHFLEHIVFKGTQKRSAFEIAATFDSLGASVDAFTTKDLVAFTIKVLPEYFEPAVEVLADMLLNPAFDGRMVELEQGVVCEEIQELCAESESLFPAWESENWSNWQAPKEFAHTARIGHLRVDGTKVDIPSFLVKGGHVVAVREKSRKNPYILEALDIAKSRGCPKWLELDGEKFQSTVKDLPQREDISTIPIQEQLIVELYSK